VEYGYNELRQSLNDFGAGRSAIHGQSFVLGSVVNF
jgi:hypothetical protein